MNRRQAVLALMAMAGGILERNAEAQVPKPPRLPQTAHPKQLEHYGAPISIATLSAAPPPVSVTFLLDTVSDFQVVRGNETITISIDEMWKALKEKPDDPCAPKPNVNCPAIYGPLPDGWSCDPGGWQPLPGDIFKPNL